MAEPIPTSAIPPWMIARDPAGSLVLAGQHVRVSLAEAERALERVALVLEGDHATLKFAEEMALQQIRTDRTR